MVDNTAPLLTSVFLDKDLTFVVEQRGGGTGLRRRRPGAHGRRRRFRTSGDWQVTRRAGTEIRVPRKMKLTRSVGGQIPTGFDPTSWGIPADMADSVDRVALWNIVATVDAFLSRWIHAQSN